MKTQLFRKSWLLIVLLALIWLGATRVDARPRIQSGGTIPAEKLGEPGFSMRYVESYGEVEMGYFEDSDHLHYPVALYADGSNIWIAEERGSRILQYTNTGAFIRQLGKAGFRWGIDGQDIFAINGIAIDDDQNYWAVIGSTSYVLKFSPEGKLLQQWGERWNRGADNEHFGFPTDIEFDSKGNIYISDGDAYWSSGGNHRIQIFNKNGDYLNTIGVTGVAGADNAHLNEPHYIAIDDADQFYIVDKGNHRIQIYNVANPLAPIYVATIGTTGELGNDNVHFNRPAGVTVDLHYIYVADLENNRIQVFDRNSHSYVGTIGDGWGWDDNQFIGPTDVAVGGDGYVYVADHGNLRVQQFDSSWNYVRTYGTTSRGYHTDSYHYNLPRGVTVAPDNSIYLTEWWGRRVLKLDSNGSPLWTYGIPALASGNNDTFSSPEDVAVNSIGRVYVADSYRGQVQILSSSGSFLSSLGTGSGDGDYQFGDAAGVAIGANDTVYVADRTNHRVQIYDRNHIYLATLGETGVSGSDNAHFNEPYELTTDSAGSLYVVDHFNHRIQIYDHNHNYVRTLGVTGECSDAFDHLCAPRGVAVDQHYRVYVHHNWGHRIHVYDQNGVYLTTVGNRSGSGNGDIRDGKGIAIDNQGNLLVADTFNHRIQKFAPGVPNWRQVNLNGFGQFANESILALAVFKDKLYAGTYNSESGGEVWRVDGSKTPLAKGFSGSSNVGISRLLAFQDHLYAGTENRTTGAEIWRSSNGAQWQAVKQGGFERPNSNTRLTQFAVFNDTLYAAVGTWIEDQAQGLQIWRSLDGVQWELAEGGAFGDSNNIVATALEAIDDFLYVGTANYQTGGQLWRSGTGAPGSWAQVNASGFGSVDNGVVADVVAFNGQLYAGTRNWESGAEIWRSADGVQWIKAMKGGFGLGTSNGWVDSLVVHNQMLYASTRNYETGSQVWRTADGTDWAQVNMDGYGDRNNNRTLPGRGAIAIYEGRIHIGTVNPANGGEIWQYTPNIIKKTVTPEIGNTIEHSAPNGSKTSISVPLNAVTETIELVFEPLTTASAPAGFAFAGHTFDLSAYRDATLLTGFTFTKPVTVKIEYDDADVAGLIEDTLVLHWWNGETNAWEDAACGAYERHPAENWLAVPICHLSRFGLFAAESSRIYLPVVRR